MNSIKTLTAFAASMAVAFCAGSSAMAQDAASKDALTGEARGIVAKFAEKLKGELGGAIKADGPVKAIEVCNTAAPAIAAEASTGGWTVKRTSLKLRNAKAEPDAWEKETLAAFEAEKGKGADPAKLERAEIVDVAGVQTFRYMKAIPTAAEPCLACHGSAIAEPVKSKLAELYPRDKATGYSAGDIRGAFTLSKPLK
jgi:Protein of unknown function (DUF3365)